MPWWGRTNKLPGPLGPPWYDWDKPPGSARWDLSAIPTRILLNWWQSCRRMAYDPFQWSYGESFQPSRRLIPQYFSPWGKGTPKIETWRIKAELDTREHIPNKPEARALRRQASRSGILPPGRKPNKHRRKATPHKIGA